MELSGITLAAYPAEYMEIVLYDLAATAFTTITPTGQEIPCDIAGVIKPSTATLASFCLASKRGTSIVIRV